MCTQVESRDALSGVTSFDRCDAYNASVVLWRKLRGHPRMIRGLKPKGAAPESASSPGTPPSFASAFSPNLPLGVPLSLKRLTLPEMCLLIDPADTAEGSASITPRARDQSPFRPLTPRRFRLRFRPRRYHSRFKSRKVTGGLLPVGDFITSKLPISSFPGKRRFKCSV